MTAYNDYTRLLWRDTPIYLLPDKPDWFIPTPMADKVLQALRSDTNFPDCLIDRFTGSRDELMVQTTLLLDRIESNSDIEPYRGRSAYRSPALLKECWVHLTNRCNMACRHCMFCSSAVADEELSFDQVISVIEQAYNLGCRVFYCTGGEPFIFERFTDICDTVIGYGDAHLVILTNATLLKRFDQWLSTVPRNRVYLQISIDGDRDNHDYIRGEGAFDDLLDNIRYSTAKGFAVSLAMSVQRRNIADMGRCVDIASSCGVSHIHYLWYFKKGRAGDDQFVPASEIAGYLISAYEHANQLGVTIDNMEILKNQLFSLPCTRFDLSNACYESLAVGPDGQVYPTPALIYEPSMAGGHIDTGIGDIWKHSAVFENLRNRSLIESDDLRNHPLKFFIGGGDIDHSFIAGGIPVGCDPYSELYTQAALYLLSHNAAPVYDTTKIGLRAKMGERILSCDDDTTGVRFTHSNCVLSLPGKDGYSQVNEFYSQAAQDVNEDIVNPVWYGDEEIAHIPEHARVRSYGCGSPVLDAGIQTGETVVDLGSGTGVECFIAAKHVGSKGTVIGIDMSDAMLAVARTTAQAVAQHLGYDNVSFKKGYMESLPLETGSADVIISNCVINLSPDKRRLFGEIYRVLKPGGRLVISDIVSGGEIPLSIQYNEKLRGECIGGALSERNLFGLLSDLSFERSFVEKRFVYRVVSGYPFYSITYHAHKPHKNRLRHFVYRGPFAGVITDSGKIIQRGVHSTVPYMDTSVVPDTLFELDITGNVINIEQESCCCSPDGNACAPQKTEKFFSQDCMVCGAPLVCSTEPKTVTCRYCAARQTSSTVCENGHFVCDACHAKDALAIIRRQCISSHETDLIRLYSAIRTSKLLPMHGPEFHPLVAGVILAVYRNCGGDIPDEMIYTGIDRAAGIPGGACGFLGICGAVIGVGAASSLILGSTPFDAILRRKVQQVTHTVLGEIIGVEAPRCCQRESVIALRTVSGLSKDLFSIRLPANEPFVCMQSHKNSECIFEQCPLYLRVHA